MRKILLISYYFPPMSGGASLRMWRFCKSLSTKLEIEVLTVQNPKSFYTFDNSLISGIEDVQLHRAKVYDFNRFFTPIPILKSIIPKDAFGWLIPFIKKGKYVLKRAQFDFIIGVYPTQTSMLSSYLLSILTKVPLILDQHDLFYDCIKHNLRTSLQKKFYSNMEKRILKHASLISVVSKEFKDIFIKNYGLEQNRIIIIPNNVDLNEFKMIKITPKHIFTISYLGYVVEYHLDGIILLIKALGKLKKENGIKIRFRLVSPLTPEIKKRIMDVDEYKITEIINFVDKTTANSLMINSDVLYVTLSPKHKYVLEMESTVPSKLIEYVGCGKPILAYLPKGSAQKLITENDLGFVLTEYNINKLSLMINNLYNDPNLRERFSNNSLNVAKEFDSKEVYKRFLNKLSMLRRR